MNGYFHASNPPDATRHGYYLANVKQQPPRLYAGPYRCEVDARLDWAVLQNVMVDLGHVDTELTVYKLVFRGASLPRGGMNQHVLAAQSDSALPR